MLENRILKVLRFVNHHNHAPACFRFLQEPLDEFRFHGYEIALDTGQAHVRHQIPEESARRGVRLKNKYSTRRLIQPLQEMEQNRRFSHPRRSHEPEKTTAGRNTVLERRQRFPVRRTQVEIFRIRRHSEWLFAQIVELKNHASPFMPPALGTTPAPAIAEHWKHPPVFGMTGRDILRQIPGQCLRSRKTGIPEEKS